MAGGGPDPESGRVLPRHRPRGGDLEGVGGDSQSLLHRRHHLRRLPPHILGGSRYGYRHPRGQSASAGCGLEGGGPPCDLPEPAQGLQRLGQVQVTGYPIGIFHGSQGPSPPPEVLVEVEDGGAGERVIHITLPQRDRGRPGRTTIAHHFQCGGGISG